MVNKSNTLIIDNMEVKIEGERNLLEIIRKANIDLPTFCYHSEISIYGACRLCMVDVEGRGLVAACSTQPEPGLVVRTNTEEIRNLRKMIIELIIASHASNCPTCSKGNDCKLQTLARRFGINKVRFKVKEPNLPIDDSSPSLVRDPNKCVLCGDCVRVCEEIQSVGAIDFAYRGSKSMVLPCFGRNLDSVECVYCGQCARVCPTGALTPKSDVENVWKAIHDKSKIVIAQIAPAVRIAIGEAFGLEPGTTATGQIITALKILGFSKVFDTSFAADLTVIEETTEFIDRLSKKEKLPQFTSCCPGWVKFAEQYYPEFVNNLSSCKSPQQMFGSLAKNVLAKNLGIKTEDMVVVSIMPCTAKKFEAARPEFMKDGIKDVDYVLTTQEVIRMIQEVGLGFNSLEPGSFDLPFGFKTGAGVIFGNSGGVTEAVLRFASEKITGIKAENYEFKFVRGDDGIRTTEVQIGDRVLRIAIVNGLKNARMLIEKIKSGSETYDFVEVMACPGGCIAGAGQPIPKDFDTNKKRAKGLYENDRMLQLHKSQDNPYIKDLYASNLKEPGSEIAHELLHTSYTSRKRINECGGILINQAKTVKLEVTVCFGTSCYLKGSQKLMKSILSYVINNRLDSLVDVKASFCFENCNRGPVVKIGENVIENCTLEKACEEINKSLELTKN